MTNILCYGIDYQKIMAWSYSTIRTRPYGHAMCVCVCSTEGYPDQRNYMQVRSSLLASLVECHLGSDSVEQLGAVPKSHGTHKLYYEGVKYTYKPYRIELWPCIIYYLCIAHQIGLSTDRWFLWTIFLSMLPTLFTFINTHFFINCH